MTSTFGTWLQRFRRRFHPLHQLRRVALARFALDRVDRPWMLRLDGVPHPVAVSLGRNLGTVLSRGVAEESEERELLVGLLRANDCRHFWDVGANFGLFTFYLRAAAPVLKIEAFEPDPDYFALMDRTVRYHGLDRVRLHAVALSAQEGSARFQRDIVTGATGGLAASRATAPSHEPGSYSQALTVATSTIDLMSATLGPPDVIKIDVEGAELEVLQGGSETLRVHRPIMLMECTRQQAQVRDLLTSAGYQIRDPGSPTTIVSGLGMPFMALALDPRIHRLASAHTSQHVRS
jgi:FkbM family methyltransferase